MEDLLTHASPLDLVRACEWSTEDLRDHDHSGPDKRLEFNYTRSHDPRLFDAAGWKTAIEQSPALTVDGLHDFAELHSLSLISPEMILLITPEKLVVTAASTVSLHLAAEGLRQHLLRCGSLVHWASYLRLNTTSPWGDSSDNGMVMEYSVLKELFPSGRPALLGPLSSDHYFYFVFDDIPRHDPLCVEEDVQVNAVLHDVKLDEQTETLKTTALRILGNPAAVNACVDRAAGNHFVCSIAAGGEYEYLKLTRAADGGFSLSFETSSNDAKHYLRVIAELIAVFRPERVSLLFLFDPASKPVLDGGAKASASFHPAQYRLKNKATAEFEFGYLVHKLNFSRA